MKDIGHRRSLLQVFFTHFLLSCPDVARAVEADLARDIHKMAQYLVRHHWEEPRPLSLMASVATDESAWMVVNLLKTGQELPSSVITLPGDGNGNVCAGDDHDDHETSPLYLILCSSCGKKIASFHSQSGCPAGLGWTKSLLMPHYMNVSYFDLHLNSEVYTYSDDDSSDIVTLSEAYAVKNGPRFANVIGIWNISSCEMTYWKSPSVWERRKDLGGLTLVVSYLDYYPITDPTDRFNLTGLFPDIVRVIASGSNFKVAFQLAKDGIYGGVDSDGNLLGLIGELTRKEVDICAGGLAMSAERVELIDFSLEMYRDRVSLVIKSDFVPKLNFNVYFDALMRSSWMAFFVLIGVMSAILSVIYRSHEWEEVNLVYSATFIVLLICQKSNDSGIERAPAPSMKTVYITASFFAFLSFSLYSAVLTSTMISQSQAFHINSFEELLEYDNIALGTWRNTHAHELFLNAKKGTVHHKVHEKFMKSRPEALYSGYEESKEKFRTIDNMVAFDYIVGYLNGEGGVRPLEDFEDHIPSPLAFGFPKHSEFLAFFNYQVTKLRQSGLLHKLMLKWNLVDVQGHHESDEFTLGSLGYDNLNFPSFCLVSGMVVGVAFLILERLMSWARRQRT